MNESINQSSVSRSAYLPLKILINSPSHDIKCLNLKHLKKHEKDLVQSCTAASEYIIICRNMASENQKKAN